MPPSSSAGPKAGPSQPRKLAIEVITISSDSEDEHPLSHRTSLQVTPQRSSASSQISERSHPVVLGTPTLEAVGLKKSCGSQSSQNSQPSSSTMGTTKQNLKSISRSAPMKSLKRPAPSTNAYDVPRKSLRTTVPEDSDPEESFESRATCSSSSSAAENQPKNTSRKPMPRKQLPRRSTSSVKYKEESDQEESPESDTDSEEVDTPRRKSTPAPKSQSKKEKTAKRPKPLTAKRKGARKPPPPPPDVPTCVMCRRSECDPKDEDQVAKDSVTFFRMETFKDPASGKQMFVHYLCLFTASALHQANIPGAHRNQVEGHLWGFNTKSIMKDKNRISKLQCKFCQKNGAAVGCAIPSCTMTYHYPCGVEKGCFFSFTGAFESYCPKHIDKDRLARPPKSAWKSEDCGICFDSANHQDRLNTLVTPCCQHIFHRLCIARFSMNAGKHYVKCPSCNNVEEFKDFCDQVGIHLPNAEATWIAEEERRLNEEDERAPPVTCTPKDLKGKDTPCRCPRGPEYDEDVDGRDWNIERCAGGCGALLHRECMNLGPDEISRYCGPCCALERKVASERPVASRSRGQSSPEIEMPRARRRGQPSSQNSSQGN